MKKNKEKIKNEASSLESELSSDPHQVQNFESQWTDLEIMDEEDDFFLEEKDLQLTLFQSKKDSQNVDVDVDGEEDSSLFVSSNPQSLQSEIPSEERESSGLPLKEFLLEEVDADVLGTELESFESAEIEELESRSFDEVLSIVESLLFSTDKPLSLAVLKQAFVGTTVKTFDIKKALQELEREYSSSRRGVFLEEIGGGYQLRTKIENKNYLSKFNKAKPFRISGPALEVLSIVAYKQPCVKMEIDEIRGVESGHILRGLMDRGLCAFAGKSELPGKPMLYETTKKFLEVFGLHSLKELPSLSEIDDLIPEGMGPEDLKKEELSDLTHPLSQEIGKSYSENESELYTISEELDGISTSSDFFDQEKNREREKKDQERAQDIREARAAGEGVEDKDLRWLQRYELKLQEKEALALFDEEKTKSKQDSEVVLLLAEDEFDVQIERESLL